ncbi:MAG TPA: sigma-54 dependent transcriptional regulator [Steroidobacteraceae bacterium]|jgi:DNA-binding NtrC family response regulator|nr:sigma-54 dependent transcriptional regulator [Steroidobacteraceae bacterium]
MNGVSRSFHERPASSMPAPTSSMPAIGLLLGSSAAMQEVFRLIERVGPTDASILLTGESGTGKGLAARSIHEYSARRGMPFISINCGAIPADLIESELFGCEQACLPGEAPGRAGALDRAQGGTLLLDDITELPQGVQVRLLRVLETGRFYRLGASSEHPCDVRFIAATNRCPLQVVQSGQFREDLLYRLAVFPIEMPALRDRGNDAELLAEHFLKEQNADAMTRKRLSAAASITLKQHSWPGNVRELRNCVERAFILADATLELKPLVQNSAERERLDIRVGSRIHDMERSLIEATLDYFKGNKRRAADALGCSLKTLYNKLNGYSQSQQCVNS